MPPQRISESLAKQILDLDREGKDPVEIGQLLGLKKMQIAAVLAHRRLSAVGAVRVDERVPPDVCGTRREPDEQPPVESGPEVAVSEETATEAAAGLYVGDDLEHSDPLYWDPNDPQTVQNPHLMIMGESGSGKTYAVLCLVAELSQAGIPSIVFDYGQSFERDHMEQSFVRFANPIEHLIGEEGLTLNPLQIFPRDVQGPNAVATRISDVFDAVYRLGDIQRKVVIDAILRAFEVVGIRPSDRTTWTGVPPPLSALQATLDELASNKEYAAYKNATGVSARLITFFMLNSFRSDGGPWSWEKFIDDKDCRFCGTSSSFSSRMVRVTSDCIVCSTRPTTSRLGTAVPWTRSSERRESLDSASSSPPSSQRILTRRPSQTARRSSCFRHRTRP
jgi:hypothetical protein